MSAAAPAAGRLSRAVARRWRRLRSGHRGRQVSFVYSRRYVLDVPGAVFDPLRGERILAWLGAEGLLRRRQVRSPWPASLKALARVHSDAYLDSLHERGALTPILGFEVDDALQASLLAMQREMTGGTLAATRFALRTRGVGVNLGGGFHHAHRDSGKGFCVFNDVAVAIAEERARGFAGRVLVVDLDLHDGDGTRALFAADPTVHTFSIHNQHWGPTTAAAATALELPAGLEDGPYLEALRAHLPRVFAAHAPELVVYVAGVDGAHDDKLGNWRLSAAGLLARDRLVCGLARERRRPLPLVVVLAGGYGPEAWRYSARFFSWLLDGRRALEPPSTEEMTLQRYRRVARRLGPAELTRDGGEADDAGWGLTAEDVLADLGGVPRETRFLGYYSPHGIELALERSGFLDRLRALGFLHPTLQLELEHPAGQTLRVWGDAARRELLVEVRVRRDRHSLPAMEMLAVEWLLLQNPRAEFTAGRPRLPGQRHPGLGLVEDVAALLVLACDRLGLDGLLFVPSHYHLAAQGRSLLRFLRPADEAYFRALQAALAGLSLSQAAAALEAGRVVDAENGAPVRWRPAPMVLPVSERLKAQVGGEEYERAVAAAGAGLAFRLERA
jgi:acetoin utilization deacetylase AcuC-like enzyme